MIAVAIGAVLVSVLGCGKEEGEHSYLARTSSGAELLTWTRVDNDVSGTLAQAEVIDSLTSNAATAITASQGSPVSVGTAPVRVERRSAMFTGRVDGDSVRLQIGISGADVRINGRLDGDTLELAVPQDAGVQTVRFKQGDKSDFEPAVREITTLAKTRRKKQERVARAVITRVATAFERALDPRSGDDPCRYVARELADRIAGLSQLGTDKPSSTAACADLRVSDYGLAEGPQGVLKIVFVDSQSFFGGDQQQPVAVVTWKLKPNEDQRSTTRVRFVKQDGEWLVSGIGP
jgi:hypothetical protein